jgi:hypothetical protein
VRPAALTLVLLAALSLPSAAGADFGFKPGAEGFDVAMLKADGTPENRAGVHPGSLEVDLRLNSTGGFSDGDLRDLHLALAPGFLLNPEPVHKCSAAAFHAPRVSPFEESLSGESCPEASQIGVVAVRSSHGGGSTRHFGVFSLEPPYGAPLAIGFAPFGVPIILSSHLREADAGLTLDLEDLPQGINFQSFELTIWGTPWLHAHDGRRGNCLRETTGGSFGACPVPLTPPQLLALTKSILTLPTSCDGPARWGVSARSWQGSPAEAAIDSHDAGGLPLSIKECKNAQTDAHLRLSSDEAASGNGLVFELEIDDGSGILNPEGIARPAIRETTLALPTGLTLNPSLGAGLDVCEEAEFAREAADSLPGAGCPNASKIGTVEVEGMMGQQEDLVGSLFLATPDQNPFGTMLALYMVASSPARGLVVRSTGKIDLDPRSGRISLTFKDLPRLLYTHFTLRMRDGQRAALVSPPSCGAYAAQMDLRAWGRPEVLLHDSATFVIARGERGGPCPVGAAPFHPAAQAGSLNPQAGARTPFLLYLSRTDAEQEITSYSSQLPPGVLGRIAGIPFCPDAAIEAAKSRTGTEELLHPSCPVASTIGRTQTGYGVGAILAYAPGRLYLAGPYRGAPLSVVALNSALIGPFDLGTVVVRSAIKIDPRSAQATIDSVTSDPIPHILTGVPLHLRDIRVYMDRPGFMINPTSCARFSITSTLTGSAAPFTDPRSAIATADSLYQAFDCSSLGFKPGFSLRLGGAHRRGSYPQLKATLTPRAGDANVSSAAVTLPPSLFLAQEHIRDICTTAQWRADACPAKSVIGNARAETPLLDEPLEGPVYLRSSSNPLPDLAAVIRGRGVRIELEGSIDSHRRGLRAIFRGLPDAPVSRFTMTIFGGKKRGLIASAEQLCRKPQLAEARLMGQANLGRVLRPRLGIKCAKPKGRRR